MASVQHPGAHLNWNVDVRGIGCGWREALPGSGCGWSSGQEGCFVVFAVGSAFFGKSNDFGDFRLLRSRIQHHGTAINSQEEGEKGTSRTGTVDGRRGKDGEKVQRLCGGMLYADKAGIVSRSSEGLGRMITVVVAACSSFRLTVFDVKTDILCLQIKDGGKVSLPINAARQVHKQKNRVYVLGLGYHRRVEASALKYRGVFRGLGRASSGTR